MVADTTDTHADELATEAPQGKVGRWRKEFLRVLRRTGSPRVAAQAVSIHHSSAYRRYHKDERFAQAWDKAERVGKSARFSEYEDALYTRGVEGVRKPVYQNGKRVGYVREYSDTAAIFGMKTIKPELYGIGKGNGEGGQTINLQVNVLATGDVYRAMMQATAHTTAPQCTVSNVSADGERGLPPGSTSPSPTPPTT